MANYARTPFAVRTEGLTKIYRGRQIALNSLDLEIETGSVVAVLGPNGAGKTTLVKLLLGLHLPTAGTVAILGKRMTPNAGLLRRSIGYLPADPRFPRHATPISFLDYVGRLGGLAYKARRPRLAALLRAVDLQRVAGDCVDHFSTGMKTRLAIAASLINDPEVLLWDEPSRGLDTEGRRGLLELTRQLSESKTLLLCSHHMGDVEEVCSHAVVLHDGQPVFNGLVDDLRGNLRPSEMEIVLAGDKKEMSESLKLLQGLKELESCALNKNVLRLRIKSDASHASTLANVLMGLSDRKLEMADLRTAGQQTELAIARLTMQEGSRGISRAYEPAAA